MEVKNLVHPWLKDFEMLAEKIRTLENRIYYLEGLLPNQKPQQAYQGVSTNTAGVAYPGISGGAASGTGQGWTGASSGTWIKK